MRHKSVSTCIRIRDERPSTANASRQSSNVPHLQGKIKDAVIPLMWERTDDGLPGRIRSNRTHTHNAKAVLKSIVSWASQPFRPLSPMDGVLPYCFGALLN
jgi:hypothetical protein